MDEVLRDLQKDYIEAYAAHKKDPSKPLRSSLGLFPQATLERLSLAEQAKQIIAEKAVAAPIAPAEAEDSPAKLAADARALQRELERAIAKRGGLRPAADDERSAFQQRADARAELVAKAKEGLAKQAEQKKHRKLTKRLAKLGL